MFVCVSVLKVCFSYIQFDNLGVLLDGKNMFVLLRKQGQKEDLVEIKPSKRQLDQVSLKDE